MYLVGGKRWVANNLALVLFKHHWLNRCLHKVKYVNVSISMGEIRKKILACTKSNISKISNILIYLGVMNR